MGVRGSSRRRTAKGIDTRHPCPIPESPAPDTSCETGDIECLLTSPQRAFPLNGTEAVNLLIDKDPTTGHDFRNVETTDYESFSSADHVPTDNARTTLNDEKSANCGRPTMAIGPRRLEPQSDAAWSLVMAQAC